MQKLLVFILAVLCIVSCQKDENNESPQSKAYHYPLAIGNYWVYQHVDVNSSGVEIIYSKLDSLYINRDTTISGKKYFIIEGTYHPMYNNPGMIDILRDSAGYIVSSKGKRIFAENNFSDVLYNYTGVDPMTQDTLYTMSARMEKVSNPVTVLAGTFEVVNRKETLLTKISYPGIDNPRYADNYYAKNIGPILKTHYYLSDSRPMQKRLLRYHITQ